MIDPLHRGIGGRKKVERNRAGPEDGGSGDGPDGPKTGIPLTIGYLFAVPDDADPEDVDRITMFQLPADFPHDSSGLTIDVSVKSKIMSFPISPGDTFDFTTIVPDGVDFFLLNGIAQDDEIPATGPPLFAFGIDFESEDVVSELSVYSLAELILGDLNRDGATNLLDVDPFIDVVSSGDYQVEADCNEDGVVNLLDVDFFIAILGG